MEQENTRDPSSAGKRIVLFTVLAAMIGLLVAYEKAMAELSHFTLLDSIG